MAYIKPDFSQEKLQHKRFVSLLYEGQSNHIDGYLSFTIVDKKPVLEKKKINEDNLVLATLSSGEILYVDTNGNLSKGFAIKSF